tara:strand:- start:4480 stop:4737 length:258 start_codon:yes stop_codon:yes gene_type:complete
MEYRFGPDKGPFLGTSDEWIKLRNIVAKWNTIDHNTVQVKCPHCGKVNRHTLIPDSSGHRECSGVSYDSKYTPTYYDCPGYVIKK